MTTTKKRGLGKSLDVLLAHHVMIEKELTKETSMFIRELPINQIQPGQLQPRSIMDTNMLEELANSIRTQGIIQPLIVRRSGLHAEELFEIIAGERRFRAAKLAGLPTVPVIIRQNVQNKTALAIALIENIQRENLNAIEEARAYQRLIKEHGLTQQEVANIVGKSRATVANFLRLLDLPEGVQDLLINKQLDMGHARALLSLVDKVQQEKLAWRVINQQLSVRETEKIVKKLLGHDQGNIQQPLQTVNTKQLQAGLSKQFNLTVTIQCNVRGRGKLVIHYHNLQEFDQLMAQLQGN